MVVGPAAATPFTEQTPDGNRVPSPLFLGRKYEITVEDGVSAPFVVVVEDDFRLGGRFEGVVSKYAAQPPQKWSRILRPAA
jgi:hypothetical protein